MWNHTPELCINPGFPQGQYFRGRGGSIQVEQKRMRVLVHSAESPATPAAAISIDSDMVVILASLLCALICVAGLALVARCACRRRGAATTTTTTTTTPAATSPAPKGLKKKAIDALPTVSFALKQQQQQAECAICLAEFAGGEELRLLPHCGHAFHVSCIDTWLGTHATCPSCRATVGTSTLFLPLPGRCRRCGEVDLPTLHDFSTATATAHHNTPP
ncbi:Os02g0832150 [Oryza sativa Japonica Group]|uniref:RING-type E3 ubiquitin transferase n=4 Tax=Oryza sativa subsp. japonica TaxID=39947 RepID=C7IZ95_ORYSJ|nr:Os02g0832150 [Oryza sativa Japonica Group]|eukprot:NP_001173220.1 Os02g0832150 [Oryza sativa Japonica Group]